MVPMYICEIGFEVGLIMDICKELSFVDMFDIYLTFRLGLYMSFIIKHRLPLPFMT